MLKLRKRSILLTVGLFFAVINLAQASNIQELFRNPQDPISGNSKGKVTVVEFFDYQCSYCITMTAVIDSIIANNPNVRVVYKEYPIRGPLSEFASRAALAANKQGKYKYYLFNRALLNSKEDLTRASVLEIARQVGLNVAKLQQEMDSDSISEQLKANFELAQNLNVNATPAFFIGKTNAKNEKNVEFVLGAMSKSELLSAIEKSEK